MRPAGRQPSPEEAKTIAIAALGFIAGDSDRLGRFLALTGLGPSNLRQAAADPTFLAGVLDHMMADESLLMVFAEHQSIAVDAIVRARATVDTSSNTRFTVHGNVVMPRTSLNVAWTGTVGVEPIVNGDLELDSLGSLADPGASVGIVCCGDGQREARLIAALDDPALDPDERVRAVARASFRRTSGDLADVVVNGWQFCGSKGCPLPDDSSSLSPP